MTALNILIVDDNRSAADALARLLALGGDQVAAAYDGNTAIERIRTDPPDLVLTDLRMEPVDGMEVLRAARAMEPPVEVIVFTAFGAVEVAVEAMQLGARDFLTKPVTAEQIVERLAPLRADGATHPTDDPEFIANADSSLRLVDTLGRAAGVPSSVWLEGELGSGRGFAARYLHRVDRADAPFSEINPARPFTWPETGTAVLPNVDQLSMSAQAQLARDLATVPENLRVIATSGPDPRRLIAEGRLDAELFYALSVILIEVPPLRNRSEDVLPMLDAALDRFAARYRRPRPKLTGEQRKALSAHGWPGNVRELRNLAERAVVMGADALHIDVQAPKTAGLPQLEPGFSLANYLESVEKRLLIEALRRAGGDRAQAGKLLGVERNTLRYKLNKYGLLEK
ncbi:MAG: sigma-54-dependent Fis family transcriptional regulator [Deltaproteobacteria bacterium]|nr:MAG: sigma-54-dependent Fis family transcriptional regulator [Deltaproteobacteria bacterium]